VDLASILTARGVFPTFHVSLLRPYYASDDAVFPNRQIPPGFDLEGPREPEHEVDEILAHQWNGRTLKFLVKWATGDSSWINYQDAQHLIALDQYLIIRGVTDPKDLPKT
ncbi:hypothetical protein DL93DRAFT_2026536, partial [Clavulina sp. PMI_390]